MIPILHPSMTLITIPLGLASSFFNGFYLSFKIPKFAFFRQILEFLWLSSKILNIMSVGTI